MKKTTLFILITFITVTTNAQTVIWSSDSEDYATDWFVDDLDADGYTWELYSEASILGFVDDGLLFGSRSWEPGPPAEALDPDNLLITPTFTIPVAVTSIMFKMKVASSDPIYFTENFAVYVYDTAIGETFDNLIHEETLTEGGAGTAKDIMAAIPDSFAGKTVGLIIRHYNCFDQNLLLVDDFEVSHGTLSNDENVYSKIKVLALNKTIGLYNLPASTSYNLYNMTGQEIMKGSTNQREYVIEASTLASGVYIVELGDANTNAVIRKKVVLQ